MSDKRTLPGCEWMTDAQYQSYEFAVGLMEENFKTFIFITIADGPDSDKQTPCSAHGAGDKCIISDALLAIGHDYAQSDAPRGFNN